MLSLSMQSMDGLMGLILLEPRLMSPTPCVLDSLKDVLSAQDRYYHTVLM